MAKTISRYSFGESNIGGRVILLFLLYLLAIYELYTMGIMGMALICALPIVALGIIVALAYPMTVFWITFIMNYFIMYLNKMNMMPLPISGVMEILDIVLIVIALTLHNQFKFYRLSNFMLPLILAWCFFCCLEMFNDTCNLGYQIGSWYMGARLLAGQLLYALIICILYVDSPERLNKYLRIWAICSIIAAVYCWKQKTIGFNHTEQVWLDTVGYTTHRVNGIIRYWSVFNDSATFGCCMASSAALFLAAGAFAKLKADKIFYIVTCLLCVWAFFNSGTRTAIVAFGAGVICFVFLSRSVKIAVPVAVFGALFFFILIFTNIGQGNNQIRRMRSAFNKDDASMGVREYNKKQLAKYLAEAPWGLGIGMNYDVVPPFNKYSIASRVPPDSEYVYIWVHTGKIGITVFVILQVLILLGGCANVLRLKNKSLIGIGAGFCSAFFAIQLSAYANQILMQYPNCFLFYGSMAICYVLPWMEKDFETMEQKRYQQYLEKKEEKERKKRESRV